MSFQINTILFIVVIILAIGIGAGTVTLLPTKNSKKEEGATE